MRKSNWVYLGDGWHHRPAWKVAINTVLRFVQKGRKHQWLIATKAAGADLFTCEPVAIGYCFTKVEMRDAP